MLGILVLLLEHPITFGMKRTKLIEKAIIARKFFWMVSIALMTISCDVLESDPDVLKPTTDITGKEVFVMANGASFIDLNTKLQTNVPARIAITSEVRRGELTDLGKGILQYSPAVGSSKARDGFEFTVYTLNNEIILRDSVIIIIENDSTNLPCNIYPIPDYVYGVGQDPVVIDVTRNDIICGGAVTVAIFKPGNSFPPYFGQAEVQGNKIKYTPGSTFDGSDQIMYKITAAGDTSRSAYGIVYIAGDSVCSFRLMNDQYVFNEYALDSLTVLPVFQNDSLCHTTTQYQVNVKSSPVFGQATPVTNGVSYKVPVSVSFPFTDNFTYEVCIDAVCKTARVDLRLMKDSVFACSIQAKSDSFAIPPENVEIFYFPVVLNDSICGTLKSLEIIKPPLYGASAVSSESISYIPNPQQQIDDMLEYEICNSDNECSKTTVFIGRPN
jgi:hypothetical protein